jgi:hypothetical protein
MDDFAAMGEQDLIQSIKLGLLRDLARSVGSGTATHQELAIARGLLRDNKMTVPPDEGGDDAELPHRATDRPLPARQFPDYGHTE